MIFDLHDSVKKSDLEGKIVFWDLDGTLAPFRFNGHIGDPEGSRHGMSMREVDNGIYLSRTPSRFIKRVIKDCNAEKNLVITHCHCEREVADKHKWLDLHFPMIKERFVIDESISKVETIVKYCGENGIDLSMVVYIDDSLHFLREAERAGIKCWHASSLFDYFD